MAATIRPTAMTRRRSATGGIRRPYRAPSAPPTMAPAATSATASQATSAKTMKYAAATPFTSPGQHVLHRVRAVDVVRDQDPEHREQDDPLRRAEVAAVDAGQEGGEHRDEVNVGRVVLAPAAHPARQPRLQRHQDGRPEDEEGHDLVEHRRGELQEQSRADQRSDDRADRELADPRPLAGQLPPVAEDAAERSGDETDVVRDVRGHGRVADGQQGREADEAPRADDRVDRARGQAGRHDGDRFERRHERIDCRRCHAGTSASGTGRISKCVVIGRFLMGLLPTAADDTAGDGERPGYEFADRDRGALRDDPSRARSLGG